MPRPAACIPLLVALLLWAAPALGALPAGLEGYARISAEQAAQLGEPQGVIRVTAACGELPFDGASATYFIPQDRAGDAFDGALAIDEQPGFAYSVLAPDGFSREAALERSMGLTLYGVSADAVVSAKLVFTPLPVLCMATQSGEMPGDEDEDGQLRIYTAMQGRIHCTRTPMEINLRGNTSKWLPKKSYRVKLVDEWGDKRSLPLCGLRSDDDWILNPMYADTSKIREALAYALWAQINSVGEAAASSRLAYAEVLFHGEYWGLYGVQERIDRKQVGANKLTGILYKVFANDRPTPDQLLACTDAARCGGLEIKHMGQYVANPWAPAAAYMSLLDGDGSVHGAQLSLRNAIDYGLWAMVTQAHDCHFKNQFLHAVYTDDGYILYKIPWDLNNTFGDVWLLESERENYTGYRLGKLVMDGAFARLVQSGDAQILRAIVARYRALRADTLDTARIMAKARALHEPIYAAIVRDGRRWPQCGMGEGNADNIRDIETSLLDTLHRMDSWIDALAASI